MRQRSTPLSALLCLLGLLLATAGAPSAASSERFALHSDAWVNLHHFLYHMSRNALLDNKRRGSIVATREADLALTPAPEDLVVWQSAMQTYAKYGRRDLLMNADMRLIKDIIVGGNAEIPRGADAEPLYQALRNAMPVYRRVWWPEHDRLNQAAIESLRRQLTEHGEAMTEQMVARYNAAWPDQPVRVDLTPYADARGAYTTGEEPPYLSNHIVFSSDHPRYHGLPGFEMLFHEVGHGLPFSTQIEPASQAAAKALSLAESGVWHRYQFYATGAAMRQVIGPDYQSYADRRQMWSNEEGQALRLAFEQAEPVAGNLTGYFKRVHQARPEP